MKKLNIYTALLIAALGLGSCMNEDWQAPDFGDNPPYGNNEIIPSTSNKITIADLKAKYANVFSSNGYKLIEEDLQLHAVVNGNDQGGNLYKQISIQLLLLILTSDVQVVLMMCGLNGVLHPKCYVPAMTPL